MRLLLLFGLLFFTAGVVSAETVSPWQSMRFNGNAFVSGSGAGAILVRDGYLPKPAGVAGLSDDLLPEGTGALAVYCYRQTAGGKLRPHGAYQPMTGLAVTVAGGSFSVAGRSDASGYLIIALPAGTYHLQLFGRSTTIDVQNGKTALAALRGGKRMVD